MKKNSGFTLIRLLRHRRRSCKGFTLIELMVAVSIIAILAVIGVAVYGTVQEKSRDARRKADVDAIANAYEQNYDPVKNKYKLLAQTDFQSGKFPAPHEKPKGYYDGFNSSQYFQLDIAKGSSWMVCARLEGQQSLCTQNSSSCYCRASTQGSKAEIISSGGAFSTLMLGADGSAVPVSPIPTDGLVLWLRADDIKQSDPTQVSGSNVIKWVSSPYCCNKDAIKKGAYNTPVLVSNQINGKPLVRFTNACCWSGQQVLEVPALTGNTFWTLIFVGRYVSNYPLSMGNPPWETNVPNAGFYMGNQMPFYQGISSSNRQYNPYNNFPNWSSTNTIVTLSYNGNPFCYLLLNSTNCSGYNGNITNTSFTENFLIGGILSNSSIVGWFGSADFAEIIMYNRPLAGSAAVDAERNEVINYLKSKYGL